MKYTIIFLLLLTSCRTNPISYLPIEFYKLNIANPDIDDYVIYNHQGKSDSAIVNSVIDFNKKTMHIDSILKRSTYARFFYKQDRDLNKDYNDGGDPEVIRDYANKVIIAIWWDNYTNNKNDTILSVRYRIELEKEKIDYHTVCWPFKPPMDSLLLNPIPRR